MALPAGYTKLEYIESSGTQKLITDFIPKLTTRVVMDMQFTDLTAQNTPISSWATPFWFGVYINASINWTYLYNSTNTGSSSGIKADTARHLFDLDGKNKKFIVDATQLVNMTITNEPTSNATVPLTFFVRNYGTSFNYYAKMKLFRCWVYDNGVLAREYIPCKYGTQVGVYDLVNNTFTAGDGLLAGPSVEEYLSMDYIEMVGGEKIDTGIVPTTNTKWELDALFPTATATQHNGVNGGSTGRVYVSTNSTDKLGLSYITLTTATYANDHKRHLFTVDIPNLEGKIDTEVVYSFAGGSFSCDTTIGIGTATGATSYTCRENVYGSRIYSGSTLLQSLHPVKRKSDGKLGMFDSVTQAFFSCTGNPVKAKNNVSSLSSIALAKFGSSGPVYTVLTTLKHLYNGVTTTVWNSLTGVSISGTQQVGSTLTANTTPSSVATLCSYQWYRGSTAISGATSRTYTLVDADRANTIKVTATLGATSVTSAATGKIYGWKTVTGDLYNMTSATTPSPFKVTSGLWRFFANFDDITTGMSLPSGNTTHTDVIDLATSYKITTISLKFLNKYNAYTRKANATIKVEGSLNNSSWTTLVNNTSLSVTDHTGETGPFPASSTPSITEGEYRYLRLTTTVKQASNSNAWITSLKVTKYKTWSNA